MTRGTVTRGISGRRVSGHHIDSKQQTDKCSQRGKFKCLSPQSTLPIASRDHLCKCMQTYNNFTISRRPHFIHGFLQHVYRSTERSCANCLQSKTHERVILRAATHVVYISVRGVFSGRRKDSHRRCGRILLRIRCATLTRQKTHQYRIYYAMLEIHDNSLQTVSGARSSTPTNIWE